VRQTERNVRKGVFMRRFLLTASTILCALFLGGTVCFSFGRYPGSIVRAAPRLQKTGHPEGEKVVIVIDPGHGGENRGTTENGHEEKLMTMTTALAMYEELLLYDDVEVYLTRTDDRDLSIKKRAEFAESVDADFLFSIHYNASKNHELYGSEVWVSASAPYNAYGYQFGCEVLTDMREMGLLVRGVKTRLGDKGLDYYGIIRESVNLDIPAVIIEHCHVDEAHDTDYCDDDEKLRAFGRLDAVAVARYFGLKSSALGVDYSGHPLADADADEKVKATLSDSTEPDVCRIAFSDADYEKGTLALEVTAADYDSTLLYYSYSLDGGETFSVREAWPGSDALTGSWQDTFTLRLEIEPGTKPEVVVRAYNLYDLYTESNLYESQIFPLPPKEPGTMPEDAESPGPDILPVDAKALEPEAREENDLMGTLTVCLVCAGLVCMLAAAVQGISYCRRRKRRFR